MFCAFLRQHCIPGCILGLNMETPESELLCFEYPKPRILETGSPSVDERWHVGTVCLWSLSPIPWGHLVVLFSILIIRLDILSPWGNFQVYQCRPHHVDWCWSSKGCGAPRRGGAWIILSFCWILSRHRPVSQELLSFQLKASNLKALSSYVSHFPRAGATRDPTEACSYGDCNRFQGKKMFSMQWHFTFLSPFSSSLLLTNNWEIETILFMILLIQDFEILGLGGAGENLVFSPQWRIPICISVLKKKTKQTLRWDFSWTILKIVSLI